MSYETAKLLDDDPAVCQVCGQACRVSDALLTNVHDGKKGIIHRACSADGVERWNREGRPHGSPLETSRREGWEWADSPGKDGSRESVSVARYTVISDDGLVLGEFDDYLVSWAARRARSERTSDRQSTAVYDRKGRLGEDWR